MEEKKEEENNRSKLLFQSIFLMIILKLNKNIFAYLFLSFIYEKHIFQ